MLQEIRFPVYKGLRADVPFLKGDKTIVYVKVSGYCRINWGLEEGIYNGVNSVDINIEDEDVEVINEDRDHIFVHIKYKLNDDDKHNAYKNNVLDDVNGFQFLSDDGQWYNYPY